MSVEITRLPSGLTVATDSMPGVATVSLGAWIGAGTRHEAPELNGIAHLLEHMVFKGTERRSAQAIAEEIEAVGGQINAYTSRENTRSEEHTSELQSLMRISYAVFCLTKKNNRTNT